MLLLGTLLVALTLGCSGIGVRPGDMESLLASFEFSLNPAGDLSPRSQQTLRQLGLEELYQRQPYEAYDRLQLLIGEPAPPDLVFALSELAFHLGVQAERLGQPMALRYFYFSAGYAYHYLFDPLAARADQAALHGGTCRRMPVDCFDPRFRLACELYNASLSKCLRAAQQQGCLDCRERMQLIAPDGNQFTLNVRHEGFRWSPREFGPMQFCSDYKVAGLANQHRTFGLGVPLLVERVQPPEAPPAPHYPPGFTFPATAFFRFEGSLAELGRQRTGKLELYNPLNVQAVEVDGLLIPLETDLTTPIAYFLSQNNLEAIGYLGFSLVEKVQKRAGIYLPQPYEPGKIPVLFIHGLLSSPITWAPMVNDLMADPALRSKYQFWFYLYPTGNPYLVTASDLRQRLAQLRQALDPHHADASLDQMVVVGHSMGGLVAELLTVDSGDAFWRLASHVPLEQLDLPPPTRAELAPIFFFKRLPEVRRVVYIATPHQGSELSPSFIGRIARKLIRLPMKFQEDMHELMARHPQYRLGASATVFPTSIDLLAPGNPALQTLAALPKPKDTTYHTIAGIVPKTDALTRMLHGLGIYERCGDGVVPYDSARSPEAVTELIVTAEHMRVHYHPLAIEEVRQILYQHWQQVMGR